MAATSAEENQTKIVRRNRPGTRADDMYAWPEQDFNDMETVLAGRPIFLVAVCFASLTTGHHFRMTMVPLYMKQVDSLIVQWCYNKLIKYAVV